MIEGVTGNGFSDSTIDAAHFGMQTAIAEHASNNADVLSPFYTNGLEPLYPYHPYPFDPNNSPFTSEIDLNNLYSGMSFEDSIRAGEILTAGLEADRIRNQNQARTESLTRRRSLAAARERKQGGVLRYPMEGLTDSTDYLQIDIQTYKSVKSSTGSYVSAPGSGNRYSRGNIFSNRAGRRSGRNLTFRPLINLGSILLPIPSQLQDTNNVKYADSTLNGLAAAGVEGAENLMRGIDFNNLGNASEVMNNVATGVKDTVLENVGTSDAALDVVNKFLASKAVGVFGGNVSVNQLLARGNGEVINPNMELLFDGPTLRNFRFSFKFTPRNSKEAQQVKLIIRAFKRNMAPKTGGSLVGSGNWFLKSPNLFNLRYRSGRRDHPFLNKFKQCFLTDVQTTYTADGTYATYDDGTPVSMQLDLSFKEVEPIYDVDYDQGPGVAAVGY